MVSVQAPEGAYIEVKKGGKRVAKGTVNDSKGIELEVLDSTGFDVCVNQWEAWFTFSGVNSGDTVDALRTLTVSAPSGTYVVAKKGGKRVAQGTAASDVVLEVVPDSGYVVELRQWEAWFSFGADCTANASLDVLDTTTVLAPEGAYIEVKKDGKRVANGTVDATKSIDLAVVEYNDYDVCIQQWEAWFTFCDVKSTDTLGALCSLIVHAPDGTYVEVKKDGKRAAQGTAASAVTLDLVKYDDYDVHYRYDNKWYAYHDVDCKTACPKVLDKSQLTVKFPGMKLSRVTIKNQSGGTVKYRDWPTDEWMFDLDYGTYDIVLQHGAKSKVVEDVVVLGQVTVDDLVSTATIHFDGIKMNRVTIQTTTGGTVTYKDWPQDSVTFTLLKNTYQVKLQQGAATRTVVMDATGDTATVARAEVVCDLTVDFDRMKLNRVTIKTTGGGTVIYKDWPENKWEVAVLRNTYDVLLQHGAATKQVDDVDCTGTSQTLTDVTSEVTVHFEGIKMNRVTVQTTGGGTVTYKDWPQDSWVVTLLRGNYKIKFQQGAATRTVSLDASGATGEVLRSDVVCDLLIKFPGIKVNRVTVKTLSGGTVIYKDWPQDQWDVDVLQGTYEIVFQHGAKVKSVNPVDCTGTSKTLDGVVCEVTIKFPGMKLNRVTIKTDPGGGTVTYKDWPEDEWKVNLLKNQYLVDLKKGSEVKTVSLDARGDTAILDGLVCDLTIHFAGAKANRVTIQTTSGGTVTYKDWPKDKVGFALLKGNYKAALKFGSKTYTIDVDCTKDTAEYTLTVVKLLDSTGAGIEGGEVEYNLAGWKDLGETDADGELAGAIPGKIGSIDIRMKYGGASQQKRQNLHDDWVVVFQTTAATIKLVQSDGTTELEGDCQYNAGGWNTFGSGKTTTSMELLPLTYDFRVTYRGATQQIRQNIGANPVVVFQTKPVTVALRDANDTKDWGGTAQFNAGGWKTLGGGTTLATEELLPLTYDFRVTYRGATQQKRQNVDTDPNVVFQTVPVNARLLASDGVTDYAAESIQFNASGWQTLGTGTTPTNDELLPLTYDFRATYRGATQQLRQNVGTDGNVVFNTKAVTVKLLNHDGTIELSGEAKFNAGGWKPFGMTSVTDDLLPLTYDFSVSYAGATKQKRQDVDADPVVVFKTGSVVSTSGTCTQYNAGGWKPFTSGMQLLPVSYDFRYADGSQKRFTIAEGGVTNID